MTGTSLDERQLQQRNRVGNQTFLLLAYLLLADMGLQGYGIHWLKYPLNNYFIFLLCMGSYLVRILWNGSYTGQGNRKLGTSRTITAAAGLSAVVAASAIIVYFSRSSGTLADGSRARGGNILLIAIAVGLVIFTAIFLIRRQHNRDEDES